ncbi:MAG: adenylyl-sulfate kinase [Hyphomicrobiales bacterium]
MTPSDASAVKRFLARLEAVDAVPAAAGPFRLVVEECDSSRGSAVCLGTVSGGPVRLGEEVRIQPSGVLSRIARIVTSSGGTDMAGAGQTVRLTLGEGAMAARGDVIVPAAAPAEVSDQIAAHIAWKDAREPLLPGRVYLLRSGAQQVTATVTALKHRLDTATFEHIAARTLSSGEVGYCNISLGKPLVFDPFGVNHSTGSFILVDRTTGSTVAAGMIEFGLRRATNIQWQALEIDKAARAGLKGQRPCVLWFTGLSGAGKSTIASLLEKQLHAHGRHTYVLDGDNVRHGLNRDLGFTDADRVENIRRVSEAARLFVDAGLIVLVSFISPFRDERRMARELFGDGEFIEVFVDTPLDVCERRDPKGLYRKARAGQIKNFTGIDSVYEPPEAAEVRLDAGRGEAADHVSALIDELRRRGVI